MNYFRSLTTKCKAILLEDVKPTTTQKLVFSVIAIALTFALRFALHPVFGADRFVFSAFYVAVILIALFAGATWALWVSILTAPLAYWAFSEPVLSLEFKSGALAAINFFILTTGINVLFLTLLRRTLAENRRERQSAEAAAESHAALFREFNDRAVNHLQLVAALLDARSRDEQDTDYATIVARASSNTLLISDLHRQMSGHAQAATNLGLFLDQVLKAVIASSSQPEIPLTITGNQPELPSGQTISISIVAMETARRLIALGADSIAVEIGGNPSSTLIRMTGSGIDADVSPSARARTFSDIYIDATVNQLNARYGFSIDGTDAIAVLDLPDRTHSGSPSGIDHWTTGPTTRH